MTWLLPLPVFLAFILGAAFGRWVERRQARADNGRKRRT